MVLISGRLAAERITGLDPRYSSRAWRWELTLSRISAAWGCIRSNSESIACSLPRSSSLSIASRRRPRIACVLSPSAWRSSAGAQGSGQ